MGTARPRRQARHRSLRRPSRRGARRTRRGLVDRRRPRSGSPPCRRPATPSSFPTWPNGSPPASACRTTRWWHRLVERPTQREQKNPAHQQANVTDAFGVTGSVVDAPVLLVDDLVDSGWTMTEVGRLLRRAGVPLGPPRGARLVVLMPYSPDSTRAALLLTNRLVRSTRAPMTAREFWQLVERRRPSRPAPRRCDGDRRTQPASISTSAAPPDAARRCHGAELRTGTTPRRRRLARLGARRPLPRRHCASGSAPPARRFSWSPDPSSGSTIRASASSVPAEPEPRRSCRPSRRRTGRAARLAGRQRPRRRGRRSSDDRRARGRGSRDRGAGRGDLEGVTQRRDPSSRPRRRAVHRQPVRARRPVPRRQRRRPQQDRAMRCRG